MKNKFHFQNKNQKGNNVYNFQFKKDQDGKRKKETSEYLKKLMKHSKTKKRKLKDVMTSEIKHPAVWNIAIESNIDINFPHSGDTTMLDAPQLWEKQDNIPSATITRLMIDTALPSIWKRLIYDEDEAVDYQYHDILNTMKEFDKRIQECEKGGRDFNITKAHIIKEKKKEINSTKL